MAKPKKSAKKSTRKKNKRKKPAAAAAPAPKRTSRKRSGTKKSTSKRSGKRRSSAAKKTGRKRSTRSKARKFTKWSKVKGHRRRTHNPGGAIVQAALAAGAGLLGFLVTLAATYYVTKDGAQQSRNKKIVAGVIFGIAALVVAKKRPVIGAALGAGAALAAFSDYATLKMMQYLPQKPGGTTAGLVPIGAVYEQNMRGLVPMGAVYEQNMAAIVPPAPWNNPGPFGS